MVGEPAPGAARDDVLNGALSDAKPLAYLPVGQAVFCRERTNRAHLIRVEFLNTEGVPPAFGDAVVHIVRLRPEEQVIGIDAGRHIAAVTDAQTRRNGTVCQLPREPVRVDALLPAVDTRLELEVSVRERVPRDNPARLSLRGTRG